MRYGLGCAVVLVVVLVAATPVAHERVTTTVTWDREISAIFRARCVTCHQAGASAMPLSTYAQARPWARAIRHEVLTRRMPVWHAARGYGDFANDPSLSPFEIALVVAWVDGGAPRSFVPRGSPVLRVPGPPELPIAPPRALEPSHPRTREVRLPCTDGPAPSGRLAGLRPAPGEHEDLRVEARAPGGSVEVIGWFRDFDPAAAQTYWLRAPLRLPPGTRFRIERTGAGAGPASGRCELMVFVESR
jgi:mono/diheme cytochrome c family protein